MENNEKIVSVFENKPGFVRLNIAGHCYDAPNEWMEELIRQAAPFLPLDRKQANGNMIGAFILGLFSSTCGITLYIMALLNPNSNRTITTLLLLGIIFQSLAFIIVVWRQNQ